MVDGSPWAVGGGTTYASDMRAVAYSAAGGAEGVIGAGACQPSVVPGTMRAKVGIGSFVVLNRTAGYDGEAYVDSFRSPREVALDEPGGSSRSDLIVVRVEDPNVDGQWQIPADPAAGPYTFARAIPGVDPGTTSVTELGYGYSAIPIYRLDIPAGSTQLTDGMWIDLRRQVSSGQPPSPMVQESRRLTTDDIDTLTQSSWVTFPSVGTFDLQVPGWATHLQLEVKWAQLQNTGGNGCQAQFRWRLGSIASQFVKWDTSNQNSYRTSMICPDRIELDPDMRGTTQTLTLQAQKLVGDDACQADVATALSLMGQFIEESQ